MDATLEEYITAGGTPDLDELVRDNDYLGSTEEMTRGIAEWLSELVTGLVDLYGRNPDELLSHIREMDWLEHHDMPVGEGMEDIVVKVMEAILEDKRSAATMTSFHVPGWSTTLAPPTPVVDPTPEQQKDRIKRHREVRSLIAAATVELEILDTSLRVSANRKACERPSTSWPTLQWWASSFR